MGTVTIIVTKDKLRCKAKQTKPRVFLSEPNVNILYRRLVVVEKYPNGGGNELNVNNSSCFDHSTKKKRPTYITSV